MTPDAPAPAAPSDPPRALMLASIATSVFLVIAWVAALFLNGLTGTAIEFPEWVVTLILGATVGSIASKYGSRSR